MKKWAKELIVATIILSFFLSGCTSSRTSSLDLGKLTILPNGFSIVQKQYPKEEKVLIGLVVRAGEAYSPTKLPGISHLLEHVIARGICERGQEELKDFQPYRDANAQTGITGVAYFLRCYPEDYEKALKILKENLLSPDYTLLAEEKTRWAQEIKSVSLNPPGAIMNKLDSLLYQDHPFGNRGRGMDSSQVPFTEVSLTPSVLEEFRSTYYTPERMTLVVLGPVEEVKAEDFSQLPPGKGPQKEDTLPPLKKGSQREITDAVFPAWTLIYSSPNPSGTGTPSPYEETRIVPSYLAMGWAGFPPDRKEAFELLGIILSNNLQSKMMETGLLGRSSQAGITLPFSFGLSCADVNAFQFFLTSEVQDLSKIKQVVFQTIRESGENLSAEKLAAAKSIQRANLATVVADPMSYLNLLAQYLPILGFSYLQQLPDKYEKVTLEEIKEALTFLDQNYTLLFYRSLSY